MIFQFPLSTPTDTLVPLAVSYVSNTWFITVIWIFGVFFFCYFILLIARAIFLHRGYFRQAFGYKILRVRVPKEVRKDDGNSDKSQQQIQEMIGAMETVFSTIGSLKAKKGFRAWLFGRNDVFTFEMVMCHDKISFFIGVPVKHQSFIEEQIHAQYPHAEIEESVDYNIFHPTGVIRACQLVFKRDNFFPIKTYRKLESDSINSLTNTLAKIEVGDGAAIQYVIRSAPSGWRSEGIRVARAMQQGKKLKQAQRREGIWSAFGKELGNIASPKKPNEAGKEPYRLSPLEEEMVKGLDEKASKAGLDVNVRIVVSAATPDKADRYLNDVVNSYGQFNIYEFGNRFTSRHQRFFSSIIRHFVYRAFDEKARIVLNAEELASVYHLPLPVTETPKIDWLLSRKAVPPSNLPTEGISLGVAHYRNHEYDVRMKSADRRRHMYVIGKSGSGKSVFMESCVKQDIESGKGLCVIDPHGETVDHCLSFVPKERADDVILFDPGDFERPVGLNMLEFDPAHPQLRTFVINEMLKIFDKLYDLKATGGPMFETYMRNAILLLMDHPESGMTLMDVPRVLADEEYRNFKLSKCQSQEVKDFWQKEALKAGGEASLANMVPYITSKLASFIYNDYMRPIVGQQKSAFNFFEAMNNKKIIFCKLSKGKIGDLNAYLLGMIVIGKILDAALARGDMEPSKREDFYLYIDEFQNFLTDSIAVILSEARKYGLCLFIVHQFIGQLEMGANKDTKIRDAIFGNVGSMFAFRIGPEDAEFLVKEFTPVFSEYDLVNVEAFTCNAKILIDNTASRPFNFMPIMKKPTASPEEIDMIRELSRYKFGRKRELVEMEMQERRITLEEKEDDWAFSEEEEKEQDSDITKEKENKVIEEPVEQKNKKEGEREEVVEREKEDKEEGV